MAGNERSTTQYADGSPARLALPLRLPTRLNVGIVRRHKKRTRLVKVAYVGYGRLVRVRGRLTTPEGNPMQDVDVQAFTQIRDGVTPQRLLATSPRLVARVVANVRHMETDSLASQFRPGTPRSTEA